MSDEERSALAEATARLEQIAARLGEGEVPDREAAALTEEAARLAAELVAEADAQMRRAATSDE